MTLPELTSACVTELGKTGKVLLFVDNLETVTDRELVSFLDNQLPSNCWLVATSRVHKVRNFLYPKELHEMAPEDAARLLRHELKRQGLDQLAATEISDLREKAKQLYCHPLAIRWFAWACRKDERIWGVGVGAVDVREIEDFCVAHTLGILNDQAQRVLGAIQAIDGVSDPSAECIQHTSGLPEQIVELALWELECSGLVFATTDEAGFTVFSVAPLAERPASEIARKRGWESEYVQNLRSYLKVRRDENPDSPLVRDLLKLEPRKVQFYSREEKNELGARIERAMPRCPEKFKLKLKWLKAECHRHLDLPVSADDLYRECAEEALRQGSIDNADLDRIRILLEAATVAKTRGQTEPQIRRAISYLEAIRHTDYAPLRVLGTLTEMYAIIGDKRGFEEYRQKAHDYIESHTSLADPHLDALEEALERAKNHLDRRYGSQSR